MRNNCPVHCQWFESDLCVKRKCKSRKLMSRINELRSKESRIYEIMTRIKKKLTYKIQSTANSSEILLGSISTEAKIITSITNDPLGIDGIDIELAVTIRINMNSVSSGKSIPFKREINTADMPKNIAVPFKFNAEPNDRTNLVICSS